MFLCKLQNIIWIVNTQIQKCETKCYVIFYKGQITMGHKTIQSKKIVIKKILKFMVASEYKSFGLKILQKTSL